MKKLLSLFLFTSLAMSAGAQCADLYIDMVQPDAVKPGQATNLALVISNNGSTPTGTGGCTTADIVANSIVVTVTAGPNSEITGFSSTIASDPRIQINIKTTGLNNTVELTNTGPNGGFPITADDATSNAFVYLNLVAGPGLGSDFISSSIGYIAGNNPLLTGNAANNTQGDQTGNNTSSKTFLVSNLLPVHLVSFTATKSNGHSLLSWQYDNATNFSHFELERSDDGVRFSNLTNKQYKPVNAQAGLTQAFKETDISPINGLNYYRLKMVDLDGYYTHSNILKLDFNKASSGINIYPNPARDQVTIETAGIVRNGQLKVYNANGAVVYKGNITAATTQVITAGFAGGVYMVELLDAQGTRLGTGRFFKN